MQLTDEIALRADAPRRDGPCSEVLISGRKSGTVVSGCVLEAALRCAGTWLLFVSDDVPSEDMLSIYLLDDGGRMLDSARIGGPYTTGSFSGLRLDPPSTVHFRFIDDAGWSVRVLEKGQFSFPWWPDARGVWRGAQLLRRFEVRRTRS
jgi:hypothetical protein